MLTLTNGSMRHDKGQVTNYPNNKAANVCSQSAYLCLNIRVKYKIVTPTNLFVYIYRNLPL